jgi:hypothetical protein
MPGMLASGGPESESYPSADTDRPTPDPVACPYLGLPDDPRSRFMFATPAHRCYAERKPSEVNVDYQGRYCLSDLFPSCPRYASSAVKVGGPTPPLTSRPSIQRDVRPSPVISVLDTVRPAIDRDEGSRPIGAVDGRPPFEDLPHGPIPSILKPVPDEVSVQLAEAAETPPSTRPSPARRLGVILVVVIVAAVILVALGPAIRLLLIK